jgi:coenzyme PQQ precursor peptide PqqA
LQRSVTTAVIDAPHAVLRAVTNLWRAFYNLDDACGQLRVSFGVDEDVESRQQWARRPQMAWKTPKIVEVPVGMEINMYACAARK